MTFAHATEPSPPLPAVRLTPRFVPLLPKGADVPHLPLFSRLRSPFALSVSANSGGLDVRRSVCSPTTDVPVSPDDVASANDQRKKRPRAAIHTSECDSNEADDEADDDRYPRLPELSHACSTDSTEGASCPQRKRPKQQKWRKPTYLVRKEERDVLLNEIRALEAKVEFLRRHAGLAPAAAAMGPTAGGQHSLVDTELHNNLLRESMRNQQLQLLSAQSAMSELAMHSLPQQCPLTTAIRLRRDWTQRRETLVALKRDKLRDARLLLDKRTQFLKSHDEVRETFEQAHFVTARGDLCVLHFDVVPLEGVASVRSAFAAVRGYMQHVQHADSREESNNVIHDHQPSPHHHHTGDGPDVVHDDDDSGSILHRRVLISGEEMPCEANFVVFSELTPAPTPSCNASASSGTVAFDFVDEDELYPYRPRDFMRQDATGAINVALRARKCPNSGGQESVVVLTRWVFITVHRDGLPIPTKALEDARLRITRASEEMVDAVRSHNNKQQ